MSITFRPAVRENVGLFIGLAGGTSSGKTWSAMTMAKGIVGPGRRFAVIDTENKRASHYAEIFDFDVFDFEPPFSAERYEEAVKAAFDAGYKAIIVDQFSYEHDGDGGYLDAQTADLKTRVDRYRDKYPNVSEFQAMEKLTPSSWIAPKQARKKMLQTLLRCSSTVPIIFTFRAEEKTFHTVDGKLVARKTPEWMPICGKGMPFEMTAFFMLSSDKPGYPIPIKLEGQHKHIFPIDKPINEESGRLIAEWAKGGNPKHITAADAAAEFSKINALTHLANHWKKHFAEYKASPDFAAIEAAKDARKAELTKPRDPESLVKCPKLDAEIPPGRCATCPDTDCPER